MGRRRNEVDGHTVRTVRLAVFTIVMILVSGLLAAVAHTPPIRLRPTTSPVVNDALSYQLSAVPVAALALLVTFAFARRTRLSYLRLNRTGVMRPFLTREGGGRWETDGWYLGLVMVAIAVTASLVQLSPGGFTFHWLQVAVVVPLAALNAFTEEVVFRLPYVTMGDNDTGSRAYGLVMGSVVFGALHYWGATPNGLSGALMSAFLGLVLAKSMQETRGFFWAFTIHFMLDLPLMFLLLSRTP